MCISTFFMYFTAIIYVFFINANTICLHRTTKMNNLPNKLSCMNYYIIKSNSQLNPPFFSVFLIPSNYWVFMLLLLPLYSFFFTSHCPSIIIAIAIKFALGRHVHLLNCHNCIRFSLSNYKVI